jgi:hypothetical protein
VKHFLKSNDNVSFQQCSEIIKVFESSLKNKAQTVIINIQNNQNNNTCNNTSNNNSITNNKINNITNNVSNITNNIDKLHMDVFLNTTCKDAINMSDFMKTITPTYKDIKDCHQEGIVNTISNTVVSRLKDIDVEKRPIHCSDKKRKTLYIKENDNWNKDIKHDIIKKIIDEISFKQVRALQEWVSNMSEHLSSEEYTNKLIEITRSLTDDLSLNRCYNKIIGNISDSVCI